MRPKVGSHRRPLPRISWYTAGIRVSTTWTSGNVSQRMGRMMPTWDDGAVPRFGRQWTPGFRATESNVSLSRLISASMDDAERVSGAIRIRTGGAGAHRPRLWFVRTSCHHRVAASLRVLVCPSGHEARRFVKEGCGDELRESRFSTPAPYASSHDSARRGRSRSLSRRAPLLARRL